MLLTVRRLEPRELDFNIKGMCSRVDFVLKGVELSMELSNRCIRRRRIRWAGGKW
jgi:hypothetical protein